MLHTTDTLERTVVDCDRFMDISRGGRMNRPGSRLRRQRSQEWQDYSSSDNDEDLERQGYRYSEDHGHQYEDPRVVVDSRKHDGDRGKGRGNGNKANGSNSSGRSFSHSSVELLPARNFQGYREADNDMETENCYEQTQRDGNVILTGKQMQYPTYASLPRQSHNQQAREQEVNRESQRNIANINNNSRGRLYLSLRRGPSSSSTSDNNSDATYTDSEPFARRRALDGQNVFGDSPPEPAPGTLPSRTTPPVYHIEALGRRPRLGYLESECESEPPYLPNMLSGGLSSFESQDISTLNPTQTVPDATAPSCASEDGRTNINKLNKTDNERIYSQPQQILIPKTEGATSATSTATTATPSAPPTSSPNTGGPTYSNPLPVFCSTPSSTTGPMVPVPNCVNPQLIQPATAPARVRQPFSPASAFSSTAISSSRFHFQKSCSHRCSWKMSTIVLIFVTTILTATMTYFAAMSSLSVYPESNKPCIVVSDRENTRSTTGPTELPTNVKGIGLPAQSACLVGLTDTAIYKKIILGTVLTKTLPAHESWNVWFSQLESTFVRFNFSVSHGTRLAFLARKNEPPSITAYDIMEVIADEHRLYKRATIQHDEVKFLHHLDPGTWYISIINDDTKAVIVNFHPTAARDIPTTCPNDCHEHGNCHLGKCHCFPGYIGPDCADSVCPVLCSGHGRYVHGRCRCEPGWKGAECSVQADECEIADCNGQGRCVEGTCQCNSGYRGLHCEEVDCLDPVCSGHGACIVGQCWCKIGWRGANCSEADGRLSRCFPDCSSHGVYDLESERCVCFEHWTGEDCSKAKCTLDCGQYGQCEEGRCHCEDGWTGERCDQRICDPRCLEHGQCNNGTCICIQGWMGRHCTLDGCPQGCNSHGHCNREGDTWTCHCAEGWGGRECNVPQEANCNDEVDDDEDGLTDCADSECCAREECQDSLMCLSSPDPLDILLRKQPPAVTASFYQKMKFLIEEQSVQSYAHRDEYSESRVAVVRGRVISREGNGLTGLRVSVATDPQFGFTLTRSDGWFDILVNGGGAITLQFQRNPFHPIKRTVMVPWNAIIVMSPVIMSATIEQEQQGEIGEEQEPCIDHDYDQMKPIVYQTWRPGSQGGCTTTSSVVVETQVLQESISIPGSDLHLIYQSSHAQGYLSTIHLQLTPSIIPESLRLVHLKVVVEGILLEKTFEADPDIKYTFAWNKRNIYKQKVYGLTIARVYVGYEYISCQKVVWTVRATSLRGFDMDISELGAWNLDVHHRYNFHEGVLQKGDGATIYFRQQPRVISVLMGNGQQRPLLCPECNGLARDNKLLAPVALTSGPDGSVYVGDYNLVRRITSNGQVYTVFRMRTSEVSNQYHLTLSPTDGHLYISDPERHKILRVHSLDKVEDPDSNFDVVVGSGERCLPRDKDNCGDGRPALEARLSYPKGMAVAVDNTLYFADGANIRMVDNRGIIHTLIGDHHHKRQWRPIPCSGTLKLEEVKLRWPTDLAINPLDGSLYFIDDHMVLKLTKDKRVMVVAGQPVYCKLNHNQTLKTRMIGETALGSLISFTFGPTGELYIAEVDKNNVHRIRKMTPEGELLHFAGKEGGCECEKQNCTCAADEEGALAKDTKLYSISSLTVTSDGVVHLADQGSLRILSAIPYLPQPDDQLEFQIAYPENHEIYVFNKYGQHTTTKSILTGKTIYTFLYNVNTSFGKLSAVTDASGNKVAFLRDSGNSLHTIETARGQKCRVQVTKQGLLETIVDPDNLETKFEYDSLGLLVSRSDATGRSFFYLFDENGRVTDIVRASGRVTSLTFDLSPVGASVLSVDQEQGSQLMVTVKGTSVITREGGIPIEAKLHQDGAIEIETPWQQGVVWEPASHFVLQEMLPVQAGMFPLPVKQTTFLGVEPTNVVEWNYDLKYSKRDKDKEDRGISAVERVLSVNDFQFLTVEYDWVASREIFYNSSRRPFLVVQYDSFSRPIQWLPTDTRLPLNVMYDRLGRLSGWQQGPLAETFGYDRMGHLSEIKYPDNAAMRYSYDGKTMPSKVVLPSGRRYTFHYDDNGGLKYIITPKGTRHSFLSLISIGFYKLFYIPPGNSGPYVVHFNDHRLPTMKIFPGDQGRILYRYSNQSYVSAIIYGGGKVERNYTSSGFVASESCSGNDVTVRTDYAYDGASLTSWKQEYFSPFHMTSAAFHYQYDRMFQIKMLTPRIGTLQLQSIEFRHNPKTGRIEQIGDFKLFDRTQNETVLSDGKASISRLVDALHRLRQTSLVIGDKEVFRMEIQYDSRNSVTQSKMYTSHAPTKSTVQNFSYDEDGQLIEMVGRDQWKFTYDDNGNLVTMQYMGNRIDILHDIGDRIVSFGDTPYVVDGKGFVIQRGEEGFSYNTRGELVRASRNGRYEVLYYYDAKGRLSVRKDHFGNVTQFFYGIADRPQLVTHVYNNADGRILSIVYDDTDSPIYITVNKDSYYIATDHNGSPLFIFDKAGEMVKEIQRGPYGHVLFDSRSSFYLPVDFQKGIFDPLTSMVHFGDKIYDSLVGQWLTPRWDDVLYKVMDPRNLHLYRFSRNDPVNVDRKLHNKLDLSEWITSQGIELSVLDLSAASIFGEHNPNKPPPLFIDMPSVPLVSGFACAVQQKLKNFATVSSVERPKVKREQLFETVLPKLSTQSVPFGAGITVSRLGNRAIVRSSNEAEVIRRDVFTSVFNNSYILDLHLVMHGQDVFYFVKDSTWRVNDDLNQLQRLGTAINTTVHESKVEDQRSGHQHVDIRVHADHSILNIRYGSTPQKERQRLLRHAKKHAVGQRWAQEREMILTNQRGSREWTEKEKEHILSSSSVPGYRSDYYHSVELYPELADDPANVLFHKSSQKHRR